jgi:hypothetical protein
MPGQGKVDLPPAAGVCDRRGIRADPVTTAIKARHTNTQPVHPVSRTPAER